MFFTLTSDRKCKPGVVNTTFLEVLYLPTLIGLGLLGMSFNRLFEKYDQVQGDFLSLKSIFGFATCLFLLGVNLMMSFLEYAEKYQVLRKKARILIFAAILILLTITIVELHVSLFIYLLIVLTVILAIIFLINYNWYTNYSNKENNELISVKTDWEELNHQVNFITIKLFKNLFSQK